jgi:hypothetical protein
MPNTIQQRGKGVLAGRPQPTQRSETRQHRTLAPGLEPEERGQSKEQGDRFRWIGAEAGDFVQRARVTVRHELEDAVRLDRRTSNLAAHLDPGIEQDAQKHFGLVVKAKLEGRRQSDRD